MKQNRLDEPWLEEIRQSLTDYEEELPADGWEKVAAAMAWAEEGRQPATKAKRTRTLRVVPLWLGRAAAAVMLCGIVAGGMQYFAEAPVVEDSVPAVIEPTPEYTASATVVPIAPTQTQQARAASHHTTSQELPCPEDKAPDEPLADEQTTTIEVIATPSEPLPDMHADEREVLLAMEVASTRRKPVARSWNVGLRLGSNRQGISITNENFADNVAPPDDAQDGINSQDTIPTRLYTRGATTAQDEEVIDSENHQSWSASISVSRQLIERLSIETGLTYTYLSSDITMRHSVRCHQQLHYLGIPLKLNLELCESQRWQLYTSAGTMLEHSLYGRRGSTDLHLNDWQWSVNGGLGLQYGLPGHMSLYFEPSVNYFFSHGSEVPSLRAESPLSLNLQIGIRLGL